MDEKQNPPASLGGWETIIACSLTHTTANTCNSMGRRRGKDKTRSQNRSPRGRCQPWPTAGQALSEFSCIARRLPASVSFARAPQVTLELNVGKVPVHFEDNAGEPAFGEMTQIDPTFLTKHDREAVARATGLSLQNFDDSLPIETVSTGVPFTVTPLKSLAVIQNLQVDLARAAEYLTKSAGKFFYFVSRETMDRNARLHARMLFYNGEDPATGSAAGCTAAWMVAHGVAQPEERVMIEQGVEMKRPSRIFVRAARRDNRVVNVRVGGHSVEIMRGEVFL